MQTYSQFSPTSFDSHITLEERETWLVVPCSRNRDSDCLTESNFDAALEMLGGEGSHVETHSFNHWAVGWFSIILVDANSPEAKIAHQIEEKLNDYPILDENDLSDRQFEAAQEVWKNCYNDSQRLAYVRKCRDQFHFDSFADMLGCVRGRFFNGYYSELIGE